MVRGLVEKVAKIDKTKSKLNCTKKVEFVCAHGPPYEGLGEYIRCFSRYLGTYGSSYFLMWLANCGQLSVAQNYVTSHSS